MAILALGRLVSLGAAQAFEDLKSAEALVLRDFMGAQRLRYAGYWADRSTLVLIWECVNESEAAELMSVLPSVKARLFRYELAVMQDLPEDWFV